MIKIFYDEKMVKENGGFSPSSFKPSKVIDDWSKEFDSQFLINKFKPLEKEVFYKVHKKELLVYFLVTIRDKLKLDNTNNQFLDKLQLNLKLSQLNENDLIKKVKKNKI